jgi:serine/threonine protein kinase
MSRRERAEQVCDAFERQWRLGSRASIEAFLVKVAAEDRRHLLRELIALDWTLRQQAGEQIDENEYRRRFPEELSVVESAIDSLAVSPTGNTSLDPTVDHGIGDSPSLSSASAIFVREEVPQGIGRYRILRTLGRGGFGLVYLAHDTQLDRQVALKVPRPCRLRDPEAVDSFIEEARNAARLNHPGIVRVYDVQRDGEQVHVVQEYINGTDLATLARSVQLSPQSIAEIVIAAAEAIGYAHEQGCWHRDLKPANLLIDAAGKPHVADFGLALHESLQPSRAGEIAGTPAYMSPEQIRGEAHRLDGRSDIWSLGVIFYELLTGKRPFRGETTTQLLDEIQHRDPKPPRMAAPTVPRELARIVMTCLAKRATDRYQTATDLIDDLRHWLNEQAVDPRTGGHPSERGKDVGYKAPSEIIPKGLRSFDAGDADFFLELLPGPHDREGLPKTLRFWKTKIEQTDADETFSVGLLYGPSGCGKSSWIKAGLLPRLSEHILPIYVEATAADTEVRLIKSLRKHFADLPADGDLPSLIAHLRTSGSSRGRKILLVLDQFEQWLLAHESSEEIQLIPALRQCDGGSVQCLVLVRDDFYASLNRFFQKLEVPIVEGHNSALIDLFDINHARKVLIALGRSYGKLPEPPSEPNTDQMRFVHKVVEGLASEGKVICVRLAVFAEMMKGRPWTEEGLREIGGTDGVGEKFLNETFSAKTAPPLHRVHQKAVRAVLSALLPEQGTDIKGLMKSYDELFAVSGYLQRRADFDALLAILDHEVRLITPTEPDEPEPVDSSRQRAQYYQLTHDYLVPSLRGWLTHKQKETRRGRAEINLEERARLWQLRKETKQLPSWSEWLNIVVFARPTSAIQRAILRQATVYHVCRMVLLLLFAAAAATAAIEFHRFTQAKSNVQQLATAEAEELPSIFEKLQWSRGFAIPLLKHSFADAAATPRQKLNVGLALADSEPEMLEASFQRLLDSDLTTSLVMRNLLESHRQDLTPRLWKILNDADRDSPTRFRAALALAKYDPPQEDAAQWQKCAEFVVKQLIDTAAGPPNQYVRVIAALSPARQALLPALCQTLRDRSASPQTVVGLLSEYAKDEPETLCSAMLDVEPQQFQQLFAMVRAAKPAAVNWLKQELAVAIPPRATEQQRRQRLEEQVRAVIALTLLEGEELLYRYLPHRPDPELRSRLVRELADFGVDFRILGAGLHQPVDVSVLRALLLAMGGYELNRVQRNEVLPTVERLFAEHPDAGVHSAAEWLLRTWKQDATLRSLAAIPTGRLSPPERNWLINTEAQTLAVIDAQQDPDLKRRFAVGTKEVSVEEFRRFRPTYQPNEGTAPTADCPANVISWFAAVEYCNWLSRKEGMGEEQLC